MAGRAARRSTLVRTYAWSGGRAARRRLRTFLRSSCHEGAATNGRGIPQVVVRAMPSPFCLLMSPNAAGSFDKGQVAANGPLRRTWPVPKVPVSVLFCQCTLVVIGLRERRRDRLTVRKEDNKTATGRSNMGRNDEPSRAIDLQISVTK